MMNRTGQTKSRPTLNRTLKRPKDTLKTKDVRPSVTYRIANVIKRVIIFFPSCEIVSASFHIFWK